MRKVILVLMLTAFLSGCSSTPTIKEANPTPSAPQTTTAIATTPPVTKAPETKPTATEAPKQEIGLGKTIVFKNNFEITIQSVKAIKSSDNKDAIRIVYDFKNLKEDAVMPMLSSSVQAYQQGVQLSMAFVTDGNDNSSKNIKNGALLTNVLANFEADPAGGDILIEVKPLFNLNSKNKVEFTVPYPTE